MATENKNIYRQVYNTSEDTNILADISHVSCLLTRRAMLAAAFNAANELLTIHYTGYSADRVVWDLDIFEQLFSQEPLLVNRDKITKVFFCTAENLVVPDELYDKEEAEQWLRQVHYIDASDTVRHYFLKEDKAYYIYGIPLNIEALVKISCNTAAIIPLAASQFASNYTRGVRLHGFITNDQACVSLYHYGTLLWHRVFDYTAAEDIAYEIRLVCEEHKINADKISLSCNTMSAAEHTVANSLSQYFAGVTTGTGHTINTMWSPTLSLIKQLESCG